MSKNENEVYIISQKLRSLYKSKIFLILIAILLISSIESFSTNNSERNSKTKTQNKILARLNKSLIQEKSNTGQAAVKGLTTEQIKSVVASFNRLRNQIATGQAVTGNGVKLPPAANMMQFYWSPTIAKGAQQWADRCKMGHSDYKQFTYKGEWINEINAGSWYGSEPGRMVDNWYGEIKNFDGNVDKITHVMGAPIVGHFVALSWAQSHLVGCGFCSDKAAGNIAVFLICHIYIRDTDKMPLYLQKKGNDCQCPQGWACKSKGYPGLCCPDKDNWCDKESWMWFE